MKHFGMREIDPARSHIESVKVFPENVGIRFYQTWLADRDELRSRVDVGEESVIAAVGFMFYTNLYLLPEKPMRPRFWDPRVGYFATDFRDYGTGDYGGVSRGFIQRYRLEKKDRKALLSDPVQPIVFYIDRGVPEVWRPYIKQAVEDWQGVFAQAGFSNAIVARDAPTRDRGPHVGSGRRAPQRDPLDAERAPQRPGRRRGRSAQRRGDFFAHAAVARRAEAAGNLVFHAGEPDRSARAEAAAPAGADGRAAALRAAA